MPLAFPSQGMSAAFLRWFWYLRRYCGDNYKLNLIAFRLIETKNSVSCWLTEISSWVPRRTRTVDIQNHKHFYELFDNPFVHRSFRRLWKPVLRRFCGDFSYEFNNAGSNFLYKFSVLYCFYYVIFIFSNSQLQGISEGFFKLSFAAFIKLQQGDNPIRLFLGFC